MQEEKGRITYLDVAKGIGIVFVCMGHSVTNDNIAENSTYAILLRFITQFHMALFFMINGMLYSEKYSVNPVWGVKKKIRAYYFPLVKYNMFFLLIHNLCISMFIISPEGENGYYSVKQFVIVFLKVLFGKREIMGGALWFLGALLVATIIFIVMDYMVKRIIGERYRFAVLCICILFLVYINRFIISVSVVYIYRGINSLVFFLAGYMYKCLNLNYYVNKHKGIVFAGGLSISLINAFLTEGKIISIITTMNLGLLTSIQYYFVAFAGVLMIIAASQFKLILGSKVLKIFGQASLEIMALHFLSFKIVSFVIIQLYGLSLSEKLSDYPVVYGVSGAWFILYTIVGCIVPLVIKKITLFIKEGLTKYKKSFNIKKNDK